MAKNIYFQCRKDLDLTREEACDLLETISTDRLERIENGRVTPTPSDIKELAEGYKAHHLMNYYCTHQCEIGKDYVPEVKIKELSQIVLETLNLLNQLETRKNKFIEISVDGKITEDEIRDFVDIKIELERISMAIDSLKLWTQKMLSNGSINEDVYKRIESELKANM